MRSAALPTVVLTVVFVLAGCTTGSGTAAPTEAPTMTLPEPTSPTPTAATSPTATATLSPPTTGTPTGITSLPSPTDCLTDAVPQPPTVDGVEPSPYPAPPTNRSRERIVDWTQRFEIAYFRNDMLAEESPDDGYNLTRASAYAEVRAVNATDDGYAIRFSNSGATNYESGLHADRWMAVGYLLNDTHVIRVPLTDREQPIRAANGTVVLECS
ncbi:MAG: hypothetical protein SVG88_09590 [Halobacteriales archaeon]|nr:hypothetical protein [Halobacteriales archaeon]